jgi:nitrite reductase/ring-hydroxylating ferredoxin subunit
VNRLPLRQPSGWYRVAAAGDLAPGEMLPLHVFGQELIAFRGESGRVSVLDAYCAHLGAHIGHGGFVKGDDVVCPFHNWRYNAAGANVEIPYRERPQRAAKLRAWPTLERNGVVLVWFSPVGSAPDWEPPELAEASDARFIWLEPDDTTWDIRTHPQEVCENTVDIAHFRYVHGVSGFGAVELIEDGPTLRSIASVTMQTGRGEVDGAIESELWGLGLDVVRQRGIGEATVLFSITPIDDGLVRCRYTFMVPRDGDGPNRYGQAVMREFCKQITQDIPIWEHKIYRERPKLAMGEGAIVDFRRWAEQFYEDPTGSPQDRREAAVA